MFGGVLVCTGLLPDLPEYLLQLQPFVWGGLGIFEDFVGILQKTCPSPYPPDSPYFHPSFHPARLSLQLHPSLKKAYLGVFGAWGGAARSIRLSFPAIPYPSPPFPDPSRLAIRLDGDGSLLLFVFVAGLVLGVL